MESGHDIQSADVLYPPVECQKLICIQETWLQLSLDFVIPGFIYVCKDPNSSGGGGAIFVRDGVQDRRVIRAVIYFD